MSKTPEKDKLSTQQERFCLEYLVDHNGSAAARRAEYSEDSAKEQASRLLKIPKIKERIEQLMDEQAERTRITGDRILVELFRLATLDISGAYDEKGALIPLEQMPIEVRRAISGIETEEYFDENVGSKTRINKIKFSDKIKALELLGKNKKLFTDKIDVSGTLKLEDLVAGKSEEK